MEPQLRSAYAFGVVAAMRSEGEIQAAEEESSIRSSGSSATWCRSSGANACHKKHGRRADEIRERFGDENLGPYSDFVGGWINAKLSALRWVLDDDWDELWS